MDDRRFDQLTCLFARPASRRRTLAGVLAAALAPLTTAAKPQSAACLAVGKRCSQPAGDAGRDHGKHGGKGGKGKHRRPSCAKCCSGSGAAGPDGKMRCACKPEGATCDQSSQCCSEDCRNAVCTACPAGTVFCSPDGCVNLQTNRDHCGACEHACDAGQRCVNGSCVCDGTSCPRGCCDATGACQRGVSNQACGVGGAECQTCDATCAPCDGTRCAAIEDICCDNGDGACQGGQCVACGSGESCATSRCACTATSCPDHQVCPAANPTCQTCSTAVADPTCPILGDVNHSTAPCGADSAHPGNVCVCLTTTTGAACVSTAGYIVCQSDTSTCNTDDDCYKAYPDYFPDGNTVCITGCAGNGCAGNHTACAVRCPGA